MFADSVSILEWTPFIFNKICFPKLKIIRGTCCLKKCFNKERSKGNFVRENLKKIASLMKMRSTLKVP